MYQETYQYNQTKKKKKGTKVKTIAIVLLALLLGVGGTVGLLYANGYSIFAQENEPNDYGQIPQYLSNQEEYDCDYTEIVGYGSITLNKQNQNIYFENVASNSVLLQFEVLDESGSSIHQTSLIAPGEKENLNAYELLTKGNHTLTYMISSYDINTNRLLMSGIEQIQELVIEGE